MSCLGSPWPLVVVSLALIALPGALLPLGAAFDAWARPTRGRVAWAMAAALIGLAVALLMGLILGEEDGAGAWGAARRFAVLLAMPLALVVDAAAWPAAKRWPPARHVALVAAGVAVAAAMFHAWSFLASVAPCEPPL